MFSRIRNRAGKFALPGAAALGLAGLAGCTGMPYYAQALRGEYQLLAAARPIADWLVDPATPAPLRERLMLAQRIRAFAAHDLALPDNRSYTRYADLHRASAVWNVFATPALAMDLKTWCYPFFGCAGYRGYFAQADAQALATRLQDQGLDAYVAPVPAYSTLGWFADPLLNTFVNWPEPELARLIFHELAHQLTYVGDDTRFNESFATTVEREGVRRWVAARQDPALHEQWRLAQERHSDLRALVAQTRAQLQALYQSAGHGPGTDAAGAALRQRKAEIFEQLQQRYRQLRDGRWNGFAGYDAYFGTPWNNARMAALAAYEDDVPAFVALLAHEGGDLPRFYAQVRRLGALAPAARRAALAALEPS